jgi:hypothetical protein
VAEPDDELALDDEGENEVDPEFYGHGGIVFNEDERTALGDVTGKRVLHLTYGCSEESLSLVNMGAQVTEAGDDGTTRALAEAAGLQVEFVDDTPSDLSAEFRAARRFDIVYSGYGAVDWVGGDLETWASGIHDVLVPGGRLVLYDEHPFSYTVGPSDGGGLEVVNSYFGSLTDDTGEVDDDREDDGASQPDDEDADAEDEPGWTLGDLIGTLGAAGLATVDLQEFTTSERYETPTDRLADEVDEELLNRVPSALLLVAVRLPD